MPLVSGQVQDRDKLAKCKAAWRVQQHSDFLRMSCVLWLHTYLYKLQCSRINYLFNLINLFFFFFKEIEGLFGICLFC